MLQRLEELAHDSADFAFETTLASRSFATWIARLRGERGYRFHLFLLWLPSAEMALARVAGRVRAGGHGVPEADVRRRYGRGLRNFFRLYTAIADSWELHDNSSTPARLIAAQERDGLIRFGDRALWDTLREGLRVKEKEAEYKAGAEPRVAGIPVGEVMEIFTQAGKDTIARHKALGQPIVIWRDGRIAVVPPEKINVEAQ